MEAVYHFPFSMYAIGKLWGRHGMYLDSVSRFAEFFIRIIILLEPSKLYITIVTTVEVAPPLIRLSVSISTNSRRPFCTFRSYYVLVYRT